MARRKDPNANDGLALNERQRLFCHEYLVDLNATQAAIRAGYSPGPNNSSAAVEASKLLKNPKIDRYLTPLLRDRQDRPLVTAAEVIDGLRQVKNQSLQAVPVLDHEGNETGEYRFDSSGANRALELLGKYIRMWVERSEVVDVNSAQEYAAKVVRIVLEEVKDPATQQIIAARIEALCRA